MPCWVSATPVKLLLTAAESRVPVKASVMYAKGLGPVNKLSRQRLIRPKTRDGMNAGPLAKPHAIDRSRSGPCPSHSGEGATTAHPKSPSSVWALQPPSFRPISESILRQNSVGSHVSRWRSLIRRRPARPIPTLSAPAAAVCWSATRAI